MSVLSRAIERGLAAEGRYIKTNVVIRDAPGTFKELMSLIADLGANIKHIDHERAWLSDDVHSVRVRIFFCIIISCTLN